jgi:hypothetical protein
MKFTNHSAAGANAGFSYQFERALYWLAKSSAEFCIGIETGDDVAVRGPGSSVVLEQDKHSIRGFAEPFGNRSKDLWNTLAIWMDALEARQVFQEATTFLMVTNKVLPDCIARQIGNAKSDKEVATCIAALERAAENPRETIAPLIERVLRRTRRSTLKSVVQRCELVDGSQNTFGPELRKDTLAHLQLPTWCTAHGDSIIDELLGWLHRTVLSAWQQNQAAWVPRDHFVNCLHAIIDHRRRQITRERAENLIPVTDDKIGQEKGRPFVKQLHLVTEDDTVVDNAIRDFIRCNIEKTRLSAEGNITDEDWKAFETTLSSRWQRIRARVIRMRRPNSEEDIGFEIFTETTETHREKLAGSETEQVYLTSGTYHRLADMIRVGWHPRFEELMRKFLGTA